MDDRISRQRNLNSYYKHIPYVKEDRVKHKHDRHGQYFKKKTKIEIPELKMIEEN